MNLEEKASLHIKENTTYATSMEELENASGIVKTGWCGEEGCGLAIEERSDMKVLGLPVEKEKFQGHCLICKKPTDTVAYLSKTY